MNIQKRLAKRMGRPAVVPDGERRTLLGNTHRRTFNVTDSDWEYMAELGDGCASAGIRKALWTLRNVLNKEKD